MITPQSSIARDALRQQLDMDDRVAYTAQLAAHLARASEILQHITGLVTLLPVDDRQPERMPPVLAALTRSRRLLRPEGQLDITLQAALDEAVRLARVGHGMTWTAIGDALGEDGRLVSSRRYPDIP